MVTILLSLYFPPPRPRKLFPNPGWVSIAIGVLSAPQRPPAASARRPGRVLSEGGRLFTRT